MSRNFKNNDKYNIISSVLIILFITWFFFILYSKTIINIEVKSVDNDNFKFFENSSYEKIKYYKTINHVKNNTIPICFAVVKTKPQYSLDFKITYVPCNLVEPLISKTIDLK